MSRKPTRRGSGKPTRPVSSSSHGWWTRFKDSLARWTSPKDLTVSKGLHISIQAFYLRRYAQRVVALWEKEYGRRPVVTAYTAVSLNGRPPQMLVYPEADLASVPVSWFRHNRWIRDLEMPRIPREALEKGRSVAGFSNQAQ